MRIEKNYLALTIVLVFVFSASAWGTAIINGDFESGNLNGWVASGDVGVYPYSGSNAAIMDTSDIYITELYQEFVIPMEPSQLTFDFIFQTTKIPDTDPDSYFIDALMVSLDIHSGDFIDLLVVDDQHMELDPLCSVSDPNAGGFYTLSADISSYGGETATIYFELFDEYDSYASSAILDNVSSNPVPEPSTILLLATGLAGISSYRFRRRKKE